MEEFSGDPQYQHPSAAVGKWGKGSAGQIGWGVGAVGGIGHPFHTITPTKIHQGQYQTNDPPYTCTARGPEQDGGEEYKRKERWVQLIAAGIEPGILESSPECSNSNSDRRREATDRTTPSNTTNNSAASALEPSPPPPKPSESRTIIARPTSTFGSSAAASPNPPSPPPSSQRSSPTAVAPPEEVMALFQGVIGTDYSCRYHLKSAVGKGCFSTVWLMVHVRTGRMVVGKLMDLGSMTKKNRSFALGEAENAAKCTHPNVIRFYEKICRDDFILLVFEYADAGDLFGQINARKASNKPFREREILLIIAQLCLAVSYLHDQNMMHRDLKAPNVFLTTSGLIKLGDFGFSRQYDEGLSADVGITFCGTPYYLAPELWARNPYGQKADVWSLGVILFELMALSKPFDGKDMRDLIQRVIAGRHARLPMGTYSPELVALCTSMLRVDPRERPTVREILASPVVLEGGIKMLKRSVPKLVGVSPKIRDEMVRQIDTFIEEQMHSGQPQELSY